MCAFVVTLLVATSAAADPPPAGGRLDARGAGRFAAGDELDQAVTVSRRSAYEVAGLSLTQAARYALDSRLIVTKVRPDGRAEVRQVVRAARLLDADADLRPALADALRQAVGATFTVVVGPTGEVAEFRGPADPLRVARREVPGGVAVRVWGVLDADAWRELAELTLFAPDAAAGGKPWGRATAHDWGPLGGWNGRTTFTPRGRDAGAERYEFRRALSFRPPAADAGNAPPVRLADPRFEVLAAGGLIRYDAATGRVAAAGEGFRVRGAVTAVVAGQAVRVGVEEEQGFEVRAGPPGAELRAGPAGR